jgi:hypothetical protein
MLHVATSHCQDHNLITGPRTANRGIVKIGRSGRREFRLAGSRCIFFTNSVMSLDRCLWRSEGERCAVLVSRAAMEYPALFTPEKRPIWK